MTNHAQQVLEQATHALAQAGLEGNLRHEARLLLAFVLKKDVSFLMAYPQHPCSPQELLHFEALLAQRLQHKPLSKIMGTREFYSLPFHVTQHTLDPRPDSETLVDAVLKDWPTGRALTILDLGTGTGCLLLTLLHHRPLATGHGRDLSPEALHVAIRNARDLRLEKRATFSEGSWGDGLSASFDVIISNPPYIPLDHAPSLSRTVRDYDPAQALFGGPDGLEAYRALAPHLKRLLAPQGRVYLEIGQGQEKAVTQIMADHGLRLMAWHKDLAGILRCGIFKK